MTNRQFTAFDAAEFKDWRCPVVPFKGATVFKVRGGYSVGASVPPQFCDDMYEHIMHNVVFFDQKDAQKLADKINAGDPTKTGAQRWSVDLAHWTWTPSWGSGYGFMHTMQTFGQPLAA